MTRYFIFAVISNDGRIETDCIDCGCLDFRSYLYEHIGDEFEIVEIENDELCEVYDIYDDDNVLLETYCIAKGNEILNRCDAWIYNGAELMTEWALNHGYKVLSQELTANGDMVIWVA